MYMLEQARAHGVRLLRGELDRVELAGGRVSGVRVATAGGAEQISAPALVCAAGPLQGELGRMLGVDLPIYNELHLKASINDTLGAVPRHAPMLIWDDPLRLPWDDDERAALADEPELRWLLEPLPAGAHCRPEGGAGASTLLLLWDYHGGQAEPRFPIPLDPQLAELALRGLATMVPALGAYIERVPQAYLDGGYYTRTRENRPLIGPLPAAGAHICGAFSGFGLMAACAAGELLGAQLTGDAPPDYAPAFAPARYDDPAYLAAIERWGGDGQL
jgi:glycine/D-amino acid oxidase-like deaminating enzyme